MNGIEWMVKNHVFPRSKEGRSRVKRVSLHVCRVRYLICFTGLLFDTAAYHRRASCPTH